MTTPNDVGRDFGSSDCSSASERDVRMNEAGWIKIAPGMWKPGPELSAKLAARPAPTTEELKAFIRKYASTQDEAEELINSIYGQQ